VRASASLATETMHAASAEARLGPNAVTRLAEALRERGGDVAASAVFAAARLDAYLRAPPESMVPEREVAALHEALREQLGVAEARAVGRLAGQRTAAYLLANRVPRLLVTVLPLLPAWLSARILCRAIAAHAWTFAGSGRLGVSLRRRCAVLRLAASPVCEGRHSAVPLCDYQAATIEGLFAALVHRGAQTEEAPCAAQGAPACVFITRW
jgi:divinyl protochlorophyllide a 8-vinyl-reductase